MNKRKTVVICVIALIALAALLYFFPRPLESRFEAPLDENCVIHIRCDEIIFNQSAPNEFISYKVECTEENGLIDEAIKLCTDTKVISHPANLLPWNITSWDGYNITVAIGRPDNSGEWLHFDEKEMILNKGEFKIYRITNRDFAENIIEFAKENGVLE